MAAAVHWVIFVESDAIPRGGSRHLAQQLPSLHSLRLASCLGKTSSLPNMAKDEVRHTKALLREATGGRRLRGPCGGGLLHGRHLSITQGDCNDYHDHSTRPAADGASRPHA